MGEEEGRTQGSRSVGRAPVLNADFLGPERQHVFAGGDAVTGAATVILAAGAGKSAATSMHNDLCGNENL